VRLQEVFERHRTKADFYLVYIREAHPTDGRRPNKKIQVEQPKTHERRSEVAGSCIEALKLGMPVLVDDMKDTVARAYAAMPDRLFVLKADGSVGYRGARGPRGFDVDAMEKALVEVLAKSGRSKEAAGR
jgi:hypothetical protein